MFYMKPDLCHLAFVTTGLGSLKAQDKHYFTFRRLYANYNYD